MEKETLLSIGRPQKTCMNCNAPINTIERHPSVLVARGENRQVERLDYCPDCWEHIKQESFESFWITRRNASELKIRKLTRRERAVALRALFESLWERRETEDVGPHVYFLAHLLMKWGGLKWRENAKDDAGRETVVFENPATGDRLCVEHCDMTDDVVATIKAEIEAFLRQYAS